MSDVGDFGGGEGGGEAGGGRRPGETEEEYMARLKSLGLYGGEITDQPLVPILSSDNTGFSGGVATPGSSSGLSAGSNQLSGGLNPGQGAEQSGKGMWEPDNSSSSGSVRMPPGGGGSTPGQTPHQSALANFITGNVGGGSSAGGGSQIMGSMGLDNFGKFTPKGSGSPAGRNLLLKYLNYVQPAYRNQPNPFSVDMNVGSPGVNYLNQLMRGGR